MWNHKSNNRNLLFFHAILDPASCEKQDSIQSWDWTLREMLPPTPYLTGMYHMHVLGVCHTCPSYITWYRCEHRCIRTFERLGDTIHTSRPYQKTSTLIVVCSEYNRNAKFYHPRVQVRPTRLLLQQSIGIKTTWTVPPSHFYITIHSLILVWVSRIHSSRHNGPACLRRMSRNIRGGARERVRHPNTCCFSLAPSWCASCFPPWRCWIP